MKSRIFSKAFCSIIALAVIFCFNVSAQEITGSINGTVRDSSGAIVPGATVTITDSGKNVVVRNITTNDDGVFSAPNLTSSVYNITVEASNFKKSVNTGFKVDVGSRLSVDIVLEAGNINETVTVQAEALTVNLTTPTSSTVISGDQVREIPINNRNFVQLVTLAPGVSNDLSDQIYTGTTAVGFENGSTATTAQSSQPNTVQISVNGARSSQNTFTVDGADITDRGSNLTIQAYPSVDSIGEFRVLRSLYPAESGRSGGGQVNVVTKSGTSRFSGSLFGFVRNEVFNANDFFSNQIAPVGLGDDGRAKRKPFRYLNYGYTIGGPVYFFNFGEGGDNQGMFRKWDRTFFFFSQEFRRDRRSPTLFSTVPSANVKQGIFSVPICLQAGGTPVTCQVVLPANTPLSMMRPINPTAQQYLNLVYANIPNSTAANFSLNFPTPNEADFRQEVIKIDHSVNDKLSMFYRFQNDSIPTLDANAIFSSGSGIPFVSTTSTKSPGRTHTFQTTYIASSNLIFEARYTFGYGAILSENVGLLALRRSPITPTLPYANARDRIPSVAFTSSFTSLVGFGPYDNFSWKGNIGGNVTWISGNHTFKYGLVYSKYRKNENALAGVNEGQYSGFNTPGSSAVTIATGGNTLQQTFANFLLGQNFTFAQARFDYTADLRQKAFEAFAQDEWKLRSNLTVYFGVRYSFFGAPWDRNGRLTNFIPELWMRQNAPAITGGGVRVTAANEFGIIPNLCNGVIMNTQNPTSLPNCTATLSPWGKFVVKAPKNDLAPRFGIAWDPFGKGTTAIRTGYGIYHEQVLNGFYLQNIGVNSPYQQNCSITVTGGNLSNPDPNNLCQTGAFGVAQSLRAVQWNWKTPYMQHWSFDVQHQIFKNAVLTVGYYGSKGTNLIGSFELNLVRPGQARNSICATGTTSIVSPAPTLAPCQAANFAFTSAAASTVLDQIRPFRGYRSIAMVQPRFNSSYHSLQVSGQYRFSGASQVNVAYTWSKNLTDSQNDRSAAPQNSFDIISERSRAALDRRHVFSANYIYLLPFFDKQNDIIGKLLGGWQASGIVTLNTGLPFTATTSNYDPAGLGLIAPPTTVARANVNCNPNQNAPNTQQQWFNTACFERNPTGTVPTSGQLVGNGGRGIIHGPGTKRVDFTMSKIFGFTETVKLQVRAEFFNIFNWVNFRGLQTNVTNAAFGQAISVRDPRTMQFGLKLNF